MKEPQNTVYASLPRLPGKAQRLRRTTLWYLHYFMDTWPVKIINSIGIYHCLRACGD